ncbi:MAG TPA: hypothetical protein DCW31_11790 [Lactobacillus sp.]|nr:hypothetical protein [Lactobacillus sp.]
MLFQRKLVQPKFQYGQNVFQINKAVNDTVGGDSKPVISLNLTLMDNSGQHTDCKINVFVDMREDSIFVQFCESFLAVHTELHDGFDTPQLTGATGQAIFGVANRFVNARSWSFDQPAPQLPAQSQMEESDMNGDYYG